VADWGGGMSAGCKPRIQLFPDAGNRQPHSALWSHLLMPISCHFRDCRTLPVTSLVSCKNRYNNQRTLLFTLITMKYESNNVNANGLKIGMF